MAVLVDQLLLLLVCSLLLQLVKFVPLLSPLQRTGQPFESNCVIQLLELLLELLDRFVEVEGAEWACLNKPKHTSRLFSTAASSENSTG